MFIFVYKSTYIEKNDVFCNNNEIMKFNVYIKSFEQLIVFFKWIFFRVWHIEIIYIVNEIVFVFLFIIELRAIFKLRRRRSSKRCCRNNKKYRKHKFHW